MPSSNNDSMRTLECSEPGSDEQLRSPSSRSIEEDLFKVHSPTCPLFHRAVLLVQHGAILPTGAIKCARPASRQLVRQPLTILGSHMIHVAIVLTSFKMDCRFLEADEPFPWDEIEYNRSALQLSAFTPLDEVINATRIFAAHQSSCCAPTHPIDIDVPERTLLVLLCSNAPYWYRNVGPRAFFIHEHRASLDYFRWRASGSHYRSLAH